MSVQQAQPEEGGGSSRAMLSEAQRLLEKALHLIDQDAASAHIGARLQEVIDAVDARLQ
jgi:hypothetical protein